MRTLFLLLCVAALSANPVLAADKASTDRGKELFNSTELGTNGKSCASCHAEGKGLEKSAAHDDAKLKKITNLCISQALKGHPLSTGSSDMASLVMYMKSLAPATAQ
ncbi:MAG: cytochrome C [Desulfuromonadaceae bacterium]|nr:cytochrome C [Desulfuromonadaceae bacterium]